MTVARIIGEPLRVHRPELSDAQVHEKVAAVMAEVGLTPQQINRYPHEFSGGQCQRIGIARALILEPKLIICDEPVSALDVSIRAQIVNLLQELQRRKGLALIFIAHDLAVVKHISDRVLVLYLGKPMELAAGDALYARPGHPYTEALLSAMPVPDPRVERDKVLQLLSRRHAVADRSAVGLRVPHALPEGDRGLRAGDAGAARAGRRDAGGLPAGARAAGLTHSRSQAREGLLDDRCRLSYISRSFERSTSVRSPAAATTLGKTLRRA